MAKIIRHYDSAFKQSALNVNADPQSVHTVSELEVKTPDKIKLNGHFL
jgi:hypothetical protein